VITEPARITEDAPAKPVKERRHKKPMSFKLNGSTTESRRYAAAILEVLAGVRTPTDAAAVLNLSLPAYYKLESRALTGLIDACKPPSPGRQPSPNIELVRLRKDCRRLQQDLQRYQALARTAQRTVGLPAPPDPAKKTDSKGRRKRRPVVRALKAIHRIKLVPDEPPVPEQPASVEVLQSAS
jgi:hypothetical protein